MPINASMFIALIGLFIAIAVWFRTKRVGPVMSVLIGAGIVWVIATPSAIGTVGNGVFAAINWVISQLSF